MTSKSKKQTVDDPVHVTIYNVGVGKTKRYAAVQIKPRADMRVNAQCFVVLDIKADWDDTMRNEYMENIRAIHDTAGVQSVYVVRCTRSNGEPVPRFKATKYMTEEVHEAIKNGILSSAGANMLEAFEVVATVKVDRGVVYPRIVYITDTVVNNTPDIRDAIERILGQPYYIDLIYTSDVAGKGPSCVYAATAFGGGSVHVCAAKPNQDRGGDKSKTPASSAATKIKTKELGYVSTGKVKVSSLSAKDDVDSDEELHSDSEHSSDDEILAPDDDDDESEGMLDTGVRGVGVGRGEGDEDDGKYVPEAGAEDEDDALEVSSDDEEDGGTSLLAGKFVFVGDSKIVNARADKKNALAFGQTPARDVNEYIKGEFARDVTAIATTMFKIVVYIQRRDHKDTAKIVPLTLHQHSTRATTTQSIAYVSIPFVKVRGTVVLFMVKVPDGETPLCSGVYSHVVPGVWRSSVLDIFTNNALSVTANASDKVVKAVVRQLTVAAFLTASHTENVSTIITRYRAPNNDEAFALARKIKDNARTFNDYAELFKIMQNGV